MNVFPTVMCKLQNEAERQQAIEAGIITANMYDPWLMFHARTVNKQIRYVLFTSPSYTTHALRVTLKQFIAINNLILIMPDADVRTLAALVMTTMRNLATMYYDHGLQDFIQQTETLNKSHARFKESRLKAGQYSV